PQAVGAAQPVSAETAQRMELRQRQHLHATVVALGDEQQVAVHEHAVGAQELAIGAAAAADAAQLFAAVGIEDHQLMGVLGGGDQPGAAVLGGPGGERIELVVGIVERDVVLGHGG